MPNLPSPLPAALLLLFAILPLRAEDAGGDDYQERVNAGKSQFLEKGNLRRATHEFREAMRARPDRVEAWRAMGACLVKKGDRVRGNFYLHEALRRRPQDGLTHYWLGLSFTNDRKHGPAWYHLKQALARMEASDFQDAASFQGAVKTAEKYLAEADKGGGAAFDAGATGKPALLQLEYVANLYGPPTDLRGAAVACGDDILGELLLVQAWDAEGRVIPGAALTLEWSVTPGLALDAGKISAGPKPGRETVTVTDRGSGLAAKVDLTLLGPAVKLVLTPESAVVAQRQAQPFEVNALDAAGNTVLIPRLEWTADGGGTLTRAETAQTPDSLFEPHRNAWEVPEGAATGQARITVASPDGTLKASAKVIVEKRRGDALQGRARAVTWENLSLQEALKKAAQSGKMVFVEITASWCPFCKKFEEGPLSDDRVGAALKDWLAVQIDADKHPELVERYGVTDLPVAALLTPRGTLVGMFGNNMEPEGIDPRTTTDPLLKALADARLAGPKADTDEDRRLAEAKDPVKKSGLARWYFQKVRWTDAERWAREAMKEQAGLAEEMMPIAVRASMSEGRNEEAVREIEGYVKANPKSAAAAELTYRMGQALFRLKQEARGRAAFEAVQANWPASSWARKAAQALKR
ncbi:MAG: thioredoxin family protein [Candidatus Brocadiae bacterium]|nr:thioredoxin family protein [Candidatus Brocadiia bacterium]